MPTKTSERDSYILAEAAALGERIFKTGTWDEFPVSGISTSKLRIFGQRLRGLRHQWLLKAGSPRPWAFRVPAERLPAH
jgi:hypothetical protein